MDKSSTSIVANRSADAAISPGESTLLLTEVSVKWMGKWQNYEQITLVRISAITYIAEHPLWQPEGKALRGSKVHFVSGESIVVRETPEDIAAVLP
jgi:hypothetical protein